MAVKRSKSDQFLLRLPPGLRDRIKAYAERHGRSMNEEIVRLLEREFPEPWPLAVQIQSLVSLSNALKEAINHDDLNKLGDTLLKTVEGVASGRVLGVDDETRERVAEWLEEWQAEFDEAHRDEYVASLDEEEEATASRVGKTAKFVVLDDDPFPDPSEPKKR